MLIVLKVFQYLLHSLLRLSADEIEVSAFRAIKLHEGAAASFKDLNPEGFKLQDAYEVTTVRSIPRFLQPKSTSLTITFN